MILNYVPSIIISSAKMSHFVLCYHLPDIITAAVVLSNYISVFILANSETIRSWISELFHHPSEQQFSEADSDGSVWLVRLTWAKNVPGVGANRWTITTCRLKKKYAFCYITNIIILFGMLRWLIGLIELPKTQNN